MDRLSPRPLNRYHLRYCQPRCHYIFVQWKQHRQPDPEEEYYDWKIGDVIWRIWPSPQSPANISKFALWKKWIFALKSDHHLRVTEKIQAQVINNEPEIIKLLAEAVRTTGKLPMRLGELTLPPVLAIEWDIINHYQGATDINKTSPCNGLECSASLFTPDPVISGKMGEILRSHGWWV